MIYIIIIVTLYYLKSIITIYKINTQSTIIYIPYHIMYQMILHNILYDITQHIVMPCTVSSLLLCVPSHPSPSPTCRPDSPLVGRLACVFVRAHGPPSPPSRSCCRRCWRWREDVWGNCRLEVEVHAWQALGQKIRHLDWLEGLA